MEGRVLKRREVEEYKEEFKWGLISGLTVKGADLGFECLGGELI